MECMKEDGIKIPAMMRRMGRMRVGRGDKMREKVGMADDATRVTVDLQQRRGNDGRHDGHVLRQQEDGDPEQTRRSPIWTAPWIVRAGIVSRLPVP